jgi:low temperature requirement protein LtrA
MSSFSAMRQTVPVEAIARSLWKPPTMHAGSERGGGDQGRVAAKEEPHRAEEWYELFYDLVFVASAIQIGYILKYKVEINRLWTCTMLFLVLKATWDQLMLYQNRYDTKDLLHHGFYMLEAMTAFVMCLSLGTNEETKNWDEDVEMPHFAIAAAISRVLLSAMYSQILTLPGPHRTYIRTVAVAKIISAGLLVASAAMGTSQGNFYYVWIAALLVERPVVHLTVFFATAKGNQSYRVPQHTTHLIYRQVLISSKTYSRALFFLGSYDLW